MVRKIQAIVYECECDANEFPWEGGRCTAEEPFKSVSIGDAERHEVRHERVIASIKENRKLQRTSRRIIAGKIHTGDWEDWREIFDMLVRLNRIVRRQPLFIDQSIGTYESILGLINKLGKFIWLQTTEPEPGFSAHGEAWDAINSFYNGTERKIASIDTPEYQFKLNSILGILKKRVAILKFKFEQLGGVDDVERGIRYLSDSIQRDAATLARNK